MDVYMFLSRDITAEYYAKTTYKSLQISSYKLNNQTIFLHFWRT